MASGFGGGIYAYGSTSSNRVTANISGNTEIIGNASGGNGGGIGTKDYATVNVSGGTIKRKIRVQMVAVYWYTVNGATSLFLIVLL